MPHLISYIIIRMTIGFSIGTAFAFAIMMWPLNDYPLSSDYLGTWLTVYGAGSAFALGYHATSLAFEAED